MSTEQQTSLTATSIHPGTNIGLVTLRVSQLERALLFYQGVLGFQTVEQEQGRAVLGGQDKQPLLELIEVAGARPQPARATGLYHVAILLPTRPDLGRVFLRLVEANCQIGQGDHLVSEALYVSDPDGNGLELYQDRPRSTWRWTQGTLQMATDPVDLRSLAADAQKAEPWDMLPAGTRVGHLHLQVGNIPDAKHFYTTILGFAITVEMPTALFINAGGYHHQLGMNTWQSLHAKPTPATSVGLQAYVIAIPTLAALQEVKARLTAHALPFTEEASDLIRVNDPWNHTILLKVQLTPAI
jgi:catechol 2,3-dioxygenase